MQENKTSPLEFMLANRKIIIKEVQKSPTLKDAWNSLLKKLARISEITKFNTFKSYIKTLLIVDKELNEKDKLIAELENYKTEKKQYLKKKEEMTIELTRISSENKLLKKNAKEEEEIINKKNKISISNTIPTHVEGWGVQLKDPYYRLFKKIDGKVKWIHIGKKWDQKLALDKISKFNLATVR